MTTHRTDGLSVDEALDIVGSDHGWLVEDLIRPEITCLRARIAGLEEQLRDLGIDPDDDDDDDEDLGEITGVAAWNGGEFYK